MDHTALLHAIVDYQRLKFALDCIPEATQLPPEITVCFVGIVSCGKSTLINEILGVDVLPTSMSVCTSSITKIRNSSDGIIRSYENDPDDFVEYDNIAELRESLAGRSTRSNITIEIVSQVLSGGLVITDTPGFNESDEVQRLVTTEISNSILTVFVLKPVNTTTRDENSILLNKLCTEGITPVFCVNQFDSAKEDELREAVACSYEHALMLYPNIQPAQRVYNTDVITELRSFERAMGHREMMREQIHEIIYQEETLSRVALELSFERELKINLLWIDLEHSTRFFALSAQDMRRARLKGHATPSRFARFMEHVAGNLRFFGTRRVEKYMVGLLSEMKSETCETLRTRKISLLEDLLEKHMNQKADELQDFQERLDGALNHCFTSGQFANPQCSLPSNWKDPFYGINTVEAYRNVILAQLTKAAISTYVQLNKEWRNKILHDPHVLCGQTARSDLNTVYTDDGSYMMTLCATWRTLWASMAPKILLPTFVVTDVVVSAMSGTLSPDRQKEVLPCLLDTYRYKFVEWVKTKWIDVFHDESEQIEKYVEDTLSCLKKQQNASYSMIDFEKALGALAARNKFTFSSPINHNAWVSISAKVVENSTIRGKVKYVLQRADLTILPRTCDQLTVVGAPAALHHATGWFSSSPPILSPFSGIKYSTMDAVRILMKNILESEHSTEQWWTDAIIYREYVQQTYFSKLQYVPVEAFVFLATFFTRGQIYQIISSAQRGGNHSQPVETYKEQLLHCIESTCEPVKNVVTFCRNNFLVTQNPEDIQIGMVLYSHGITMASYDCPEGEESVFEIQLSNAYDVGMLELSDR
eukprot:PhF_6_TR26444/c0_g1_i2/m.38299